jgi:nicotinamide-nucleotide amidase
LTGPARPSAALLVTGSELLLGLVADRNTSFLAQALDRLGLDLRRALVVGDGEEDIAEGLEALRGHDVVITSGGLGPTHDDRTVAAVARATGRELELDTALQATIREIMDAFARRRGVEPGAPELQAGIDKQALVPRGAHVIDPIGTAPGLVVPWEGTTVLVLPGPPSELASMWPRLEAHPAAAVLHAGARLEHSLLRIYGVGESLVAHAFDEAGGDAGGTTTTICARRAEVEVLVRAPAAARAARERLAGALRERFAGDLFAEDERSLPELVLDEARARGLTIATAESCTGGLVAGRLTDVAGSSDVVVGGIVAYANEVKQAMLGVPESILASVGAVSAECAGAMARGVRVVTGAGLALSTTGIAGPGGGTPEKPVGLVYVHCDSAAGTAARRLDLPGDRGAIREATVTAALHLALQVMRSA